ncbi:hypothetical protein ACHAWF_017044 [Thalassiosira exigua]
MAPLQQSPSTTLGDGPVAVFAAAAAAAVVTAWICSRRRDARVAKLEETRLAERTGRIRAEMKLRTYLKDREAESIVTRTPSGDELRRARSHEEVAAGAKPKRANGTEAVQPEHNLLLRCIGTIASPYTKRMGTPRQGALVPSGRGYVQLKVPVECVEGLELYSHAWVLFTFHANTDVPSPVTSNDGSIMKLKKTKIRPPRANGVKVGMLSTRSPHRPNNIGLSLVKIVRVDKKLKRLHLAALDLVNGTPVYDVKPCVPWDVPGYHDKVSLTVPDWVRQDDELESVRFSSKAEEALERCIREGKLAPLYTMQNDGLDGATETIREILAQDPRASNSNGPNKRGSTSAYSHKNDIYKLVFCSVEVEFRVNDMGVTVENVSVLDLSGVRHVDGIPILSERS